MKKLLLAGLLSCLALTSIRADLIWYESFDYADGLITNNSAGVWAIHSSSGANDVHVRNHRLEISGNSSANAPRQADINRKFCTSSCTYTSSAQVVYASFTVNCTNLPTAVQNYFAHFYSSAGQQARVYNAPGSLPSTWRLGIAGAGSTPSQVFPVHLARDVDYQIVVGWNPTTDFADGIASYSARLWVNPIDANSANVSSLDGVASPITPTMFAFRQASGTTSFFLAVSNCAVATTFSEAATAVWTTTPAAPVIAYSPKDVTNFVGNAALLSGVAAGQGLGNMTYTWLKNGSVFTNPDNNTNTLSFLSTVAADSGWYQLVATTPFGLSATSAPAYLSSSVALVRPTITTQPTNTPVYYHQTAKLGVAATGPGTITYTWYYNGSPVSTLGNPNISGDGSSELTISDVFTNNDTTGTYRCAVSNEYGGLLSSNAVLSAIAVPVVSIGYLRSLVDPVTFLPTNRTALYSASGVVTVHGTLTAAPNLSIIMQDETGGIGVFMSGGIGAGIYPQAGDRITVTGPLSDFNGGLQFSLSSANPSHSIITNSSGNALPPGVVLPFSFTNGAAVGGVGNAMRLYGSAVVTFTNVYFPVADGTTKFAAGSTYYMTNSNGESMRLFFNAAMVNLNDVVIPPFAWTVSGPMGVFLSPTTVDRSSGYELFPTDPGDIVVTPPPQVTINVALSGNNPALTWTAQPYMSYTVLRAANVNGPYIPLAGGLTFNTTLGQFVDTDAVPATRFYQVISP